MKKILPVTGFLCLFMGMMYSQDTISHIISGCVYNEKSTYDEEPCPLGVFFNYSNDTLFINGTIGANCCGTHFAVVQILRDTLFITTLDTGELCSCVCGFCFELEIPATNADTVVCLNGTIYSTREALSSDKNKYDKLFKVLPNPFDRELRITVEHEFIKNVNICDFTGKIIQNIKCSNQCEIILDTGSWPTGLYLINLITSNNKLITRKTIKE